MYGPSALKAFVTFLGFLLPALLIFLAVTIVARLLRGRRKEEGARLESRVAALEEQVAGLRRRLDDLTAHADKPRA